jgi:uncharacterized damage-inducible protein DinB
MTESHRLIAELNSAMEGDPWHGNSIATILDSVSPSQALAKPIGDAHSIWEIVRHLTAWTNEVARRLGGRPASDPEEGDWPAPSGSDQASWWRDVSRLFEAHRRLVASLEGFPDESLLEPTNDPRSLDAGVTRYVLLHGLAQHHAYHGGQISLIKKGSQGR